VVAVVLERPGTWHVAVAERAASVRDQQRACAVAFAEAGYAFVQDPWLGAVIPFIAGERDVS
jgi:hypothetical protein